MSGDDETALTATPSSGSARGGRSSAPSRIGRYEIVRLLGQGGVGAVYEAIDPDLDRHVAIKLLRDETGDTEMLRREAQALAKLGHPNVVTVHDVGVTDGEVFIVMQLVDGVTIDRWLADRHATVPEVLAMFRQAGRGLVAAHAAGLVHCDFKPGNVLVDQGGVARVGDFGLARTTRITEREPLARASMSAIAGTPAYMAPEQFDGVATAATDQFAFCVALWEALAGERPYGDSGFDVPRGPRRAISARIPPHVARALERGLAPEPADRFPSMQALLDALEPPRRAGRYAAIAAGAALAIGLGVIAVRHLTRRDPWLGADLDGRHALTSYGARACASDPIVDGTTVVYGLITGDDLDLYAVPLAGGPPRRLTSSPLEEWRPNTGRHPGEVIHLIHDRAATEASVAALDVATGHETTLLDHRLAWDAVAAGDALIFSPDDPPGMRIRDGGGDDRALADPEPGHGLFTAAVSPDHHAAAMIETDDNDGPSHVCTVPLPSGAMTCYPPPATEARPAFGAAGDAVYYGAPDGVHRYDPDREEDEVGVRTTPVEQGIAVAADGSALVYSTCRMHARIVDESDARRALADDDKALQPAVASTGALAWIRDVDTVRILIYRDPSGGIHQLTDTTAGSVRAPKFDASGRKIVFAGTGDNPGLFYVNVDVAGVIHQISKDPLALMPQWTGDGRIVFHRSDLHGNAHAFVVGLGGGDPTQLGDATSYVYAAHGDDVLVGDESLSWLDARSGKTRPGPPNPHGEVPFAASISPDGRWLALQTTPTLANVYRMRLDIPDEPHLVIAYGAGTTPSRVAIDDAGHVIGAPETWSGDLYVVPAREGSHF